MDEVAGCDGHRIQAPLSRDDVDLLAAGMVVHRTHRPRLEAQKETPLAIMQVQRRQIDALEDGTPSGVCVGGALHAYQVYASAMRPSTRFAGSVVGIDRTDFAPPAQPVH